MHTPCTHHGKRPLSFDHELACTWAYGRTNGESYLLAPTKKLQFFSKSAAIMWEMIWTLTPFITEVQRITYHFSDIQVLSNSLDGLSPLSLSLISLLYFTLMTSLALYFLSWGYCKSPFFGSVDVRLCQEPGYCANCCGSHAIVTSSIQNAFCEHPYPPPLSSWVSSKFRNQRGNISPSLDSGSA